MEVSDYVFAIAIMSSLIYAGAQLGKWCVRSLLLMILKRSKSLENACWHFTEILETERGELTAGKRVIVRTKRLKVTVELTDTPQ
jgi:hypothetical protein